jgi:hypothetical protein
MAKKNHIASWKIEDEYQLPQANLSVTNDSIQLPHMNSKIDF